jgi:hypothetical protein
MDTRLEAEGAEFLVLGHLLIEGIEAHKAYTRFPGFDVIAFDSVGQRSCRIQVKSRWETGAEGFPIKNFECDIVAFVALNRGSKRARSRPVKPPDIYVFPVEVIQPNVEISGGWSKVYLRSIEQFESYLNDWAPVRSVLELAPVVRS